MQGQCYPHHKDRGCSLLHRSDRRLRKNSLQVSLPAAQRQQQGRLFHQIRAILSGCGRIPARPLGSMSQPSPSRNMLASQPCCSMNRRSASAPRSACRSLARCPLGRRHQRPGGALAGQAAHGQNRMTVGGEVRHGSFPRQSKSGARSGSHVDRGPQGRTASDPV